MKRIFTIALIALSLSVTAEDKEEYSQFQSILMTPDYSKLATLSKNMASHNKKYHSKKPYVAKVYNVVTGLDVGKFYWFMGPSTYAHLDNRPSGDDHGKDWANNVMPYITKLEYGEYWRLMDETVIDNHKDWDKNPIDKWTVRYLTVAPDQGENIDYLFSVIKKTLEKTGKVTFWALFDNNMRQGINNGRHMQAVSAFKTWASLDDNWEFKKAFTELYGEDAWDPFWNLWDTTIVNAWDEVQVLDRKMSGMD